MRRYRWWIRSGATACLLVAFCGCGDDKVLVSAGDTCAGEVLSGPALAPQSSYIVVAHDRAETWAAAREDTAGTTLLSPHGLLGQAPNDLEYYRGALYALNSQSNTLQRIRASTGETELCLDLGPGTGPWEMMIDPYQENRAWITTFLSGELLEVDLAEPAVIRRVTMESGIEGLWVGESALAVTHTGFQGTEGAYGNGAVLIVDRATLDLLHSVPVPPNPQFLLRGPQGLLHVVCTGNYGQQEPAVWGQVVRLNAAWSSVTDTLHLGGTPGRAVLCPSGTVVVAGWFGGLTAYDGAAFTPLHTVEQPIEPSVGYSDVILGSQGIYAANFDLDALLILDLQTLAPTGFVQVSDGPTALVAVPPEIP